MRSAFVDYNLDWIFPEHLQLYKTVYIQWQISLGYLLFFYYL